MAKITIAHVKRFIAKNKGNLFIKVKSSFNGMSDMVEFDSKAEFEPAVEESFYKNTQGIRGVWLVHQAGDYVSAYSGEGYEGFAVSNCCGSWTIAVKKAAPAPIPAPEAPEPAYSFWGV